MILVIIFHNHSTLKFIKNSPKPGVNLAQTSKVEVKVKAENIVKRISTSASTYTYCESRE